MEAHCARARACSGVCFTRVRRRGFCPPPLRLAMPSVRVCPSATPEPRLRRKRRARAGPVHGSERRRLLFIGGLFAPRTGPPTNAGDAIISADGRPRAGRAAATDDGSADDIPRRRPLVKNLAARRPEPLLVRCAHAPPRRCAHAPPSRSPPHRPRATPWSWTAVRLAEPVRPVSLICCSGWGQGARPHVRV